MYPAINKKKLNSASKQSSWMLYHELGSASPYPRSLVPPPPPEEKSPLMPSTTVSQPVRTCPKRLAPNPSSSSPICTWRAWCQMYTRRASTTRAGPRATENRHHRKTSGGLTPLWTLEIGTQRPPPCSLRPLDSTMLLGLAFNSSCPGLHITTPPSGFTGSLGEGGGRGDVKVQLGPSGARTALSPALAFAAAPHTHTPYTLPPSKLKSCRSVPSSQDSSVLGPHSVLPS
mmetsp:Transcript_14189/g.38459  ORF Transcript_14189/g.38459 Transcript_14189/m.38459 type:complete len:230 (-) Transcript_14189:1115-1804(-)